MTEEILRELLSIRMELEDLADRINNVENLIDEDY